MRHLATHTSGLIDFESTLMDTYALSLKPTVALGRFLQDYYTTEGKHYRKENFADVAVEKSYDYGNIASALAAYIVEQRANMLFDAFTDKYIFLPLGVTSTHWFFDPMQSKA